MVVPDPESLNKKVSSSTVPLAACVPQEFLELEGTTFFALSPAPTFRYMLSLRNGKLRVWFEDCVSKKQWCTKDLAVEDYVDVNNAVPEIKASDYAVCFHELLSKNVNETEEFPRSIKHLHGDVLQLEMSIKVQFLMRTCVATYDFCLEPISVERIDMLESRIRDLQGEVKALRVEASATQSKQEADMDKLRLEFDTQVKGLKAMLTDRSKNDVIIQAQGTTKDDSTDKIIWTKVKNGAHINGVDGMIRSLRPGTYLANVAVNCVGKSDNAFISLMKGDKDIQLALCTDGSSGWSSTTISCVTRINTGDEISVHCPFDLDVSYPNHISLVRLGD